jgi:hypothetical protein
MWPFRKRKPVRHPGGDDLSGVPMWELEDMFKRSILKQIENLQHLSLITGLLVLKRPSEDDEEMYSQLHEALRRYKGEPELEPLRQAAIKELKRRADEGDAECADVLERRGIKAD